jgi:hypothetical protein
VVCATLANFDTRAGMKFNTQIEECTNINISIIFCLCICYTMCNKKYGYSNREHLSGNKIHNLSYGVAAFSTSFYNIN